nr:hypothetical protein Q903MT_gene1217 [Picea sitchensis]
MPRPIMGRCSNVRRINKKCLNSVNCFRVNRNLMVVNLLLALAL